VHEQLEKTGLWVQAYPKHPIKDVSQANQDVFFSYRKSHGVYPLQPPQHLLQSCNLEALTANLIPNLRERYEMN